jgi:hypothetical protein
VLRAKVQVFVDLYRKNRQLSEQAALLRSRVGDTPQSAGTVPATVEPLMTELSARLGSVEELVSVLSGQTAANPDPDVAPSVQELEHRVERLRDMVDALRAGG